MGLTGLVILGELTSKVVVELAKLAPGAGMGDGSDDNESLLQVSTVLHLFIGMPECRDELTGSYTLKQRVNREHSIMFV